MKKNKKTLIFRWLSVVSALLSCVLLSGCVRQISGDVFSFLDDYHSFGGEKYEADEILLKEKEYYIFPKTEPGQDYLLRVRTDEFSIPRKATMLTPRSADTEGDAAETRKRALLRAFCGFDDAECDELLARLSSQAGDGENRSAAGERYTATECVNELYYVFEVEDKY